ncbi:ABC transporter ATP-binding protein [Eubacterium sp. MSJ-33]|uniref:ABC transporter ATP-binding protein n=1 Tax=Eubacterium sp. MSJ-33 TaxID=2841528 RepID=UPI001C7830FF|nr:ABC transporter ATP-binding protein [Eubacterium sp. MSJ-33]QWT51869.1 ABC transporter ATP-binding protein [Eubacterium sp. MSJ-33]
MEYILEITGLNKSYPGFSLQDISFALPDGCITGFIGKNGAGKTTTLKSILGLVPKISGTIKWFGMDLSSNEKEIKERIGIVLDDGGFYDELTLSEMKSIIASAYKSWSNDDYNMYLARFSLNPKQKIGTLSKGMRMKYALALALSHKAEFLIMDEPTSGLDPLIRNQLLEILKEFMDNGGRGVFFSTHITSDLDKIADTLIMIDEGHIVFQEEKDNLLDRYRIVKGDVADLCPDTEKLLMNIDKTPFGFTAITKYADDLRKLMPDCMLERPSIEDIMLSNIKGGN